MFDESTQGLDACRMTATREPRPEVLALLRESKQRVWDDMPRLVLADWLQEHGDESERALGEVMHSQVLRTFWPWNHYWSETPDYTGRERELITAHAESWLGELARQVKWTVGRGLFRIRCSADQVAGGVFEPPPLPGGMEWVETLSLEHVSLWHSDGAKRAEEIAGSPLLARVGILDLSDAFGLTDWARILASPSLRLLSGLRPGHMLEDSCDSLFRSLDRTGLNCLDLSSAALFETPLRAFLASDRLQQFRALNLRHAVCGSKELMLLAASSACRNLHDLALYAYSATDEALAALFASPHFPSLRRLALTGNRKLTAANIEHLIHSSMPLGYLALGAEVTADAVIALAGSPWASRLTDLELGGFLNLAASRALATSPYLAGLRTLKASCFDSPVLVRRLLAERFGARWLR
jgi:uncharacterized protein (TIGR02996 family)